MIKFDVPKFTITYEDYITWRKHTGLLEEDYNNDLIGKFWYLTQASLLDEEDLIAFRLRFGV